MHEVAIKHIPKQANIQESTPQSLSSQVSFASLSSQVSVPKHLGAK